MLPDSSTVTVRNGTVHWENRDFMISVDEAEALVDEVRKKMAKPGVEGIIVDNTAASGTWPSEIDDIWGELMAEIYSDGVKCATVCPSATNAIHVNRLSKDNGTDDLIQAFRPDEKEEAHDFVGLVSA
jgi:hypothetical protein